jgi:hypothetical protein
MTDQQFNAIMGAINALAKNTVPPAQWNSFLVGSGQSQPAAPTPAETADNPGKYYKTKWDTLEGAVPFAVVECFDENVATDSEGNVTRKFVGGTLYQWAKADLPTFLRYYQFRYKNPLNLNNLHPEQRALMGL